jgi:hypothetical protein
MIESLRVLKACRKTAVGARRVALQMIHNTIVAAPDELRDVLRKMTRMQLVRTLAAWRPDLTDYRTALRPTASPSSRSVAVTWNFTTKLQISTPSSSQSSMNWLQHLSPGTRSVTALPGSCC